MTSRSVRALVVGVLFLSLYIKSDAKRDSACATNARPDDRRDGDCKDRAEDVIAPEPLERHLAMHRNVDTDDGRHSGIGS